VSSTHSSKITTFKTLDLAAGLTQVLADGTHTYLYGDGRIAQYDTSGAQYFLGDALGSVRQLVDANGEVQLAQSYEPYGAVLASIGDGTSSYAFAAEMGDSYIKLIYLRSREYSPATGRFLTKDSWQGDYTRPLSQNSWNYVEGNPVNLTDPSGHWAYPIPLAWEDALKTHRFLGEGLVLAAKSLYSKVGLSRICAFSPEPEVTNTVDDLITDYVCEYGGDSHSFGYSSPLTQQLARIHSIYELRKKFYEAGGYLDPSGQGFGLSGFIWAKVDIVFSGNEPVHFFLNINTPLNVSDYLGSYNYNISQTERDTIKFKITNLTSLESGTRLAPRKSIDDISLEEYWTNPAAYKDRHITSILSSKSQDETGGYEGGGTMEQIFRWEEPYDPLLKCWKWYPPYPVGLEFLKILPWRE
jgi:RHS repeat-associated protein